ncbi:F-box protein At1g52495-like isoform X1 [Solanum lycopersicum]|uniref:F-box protein At1g52495-like isoform X1 n=2 Tax=Solanum lycopersicum TaxID=4081 RepID=UPI003749E711
MIRIEEMQVAKTRKKQYVNNISIPKEVVVEILRRVPCEELFETIKKVCMQWCSIIYSGSFAYSHVECRILKSSSFFSQYEAVVFYQIDNTRSISVSALEWQSRPFPNYPNEDLETKYMFTIDDVLQFQVPRMITVNSVNGFVCFWSRNARVHVLNPLTEEHFTTPPYTYEIRSVTPPCLAAIGFGFCQLSYEYKVVVLQEDGEGFEIKPLVFTVGTDRSWRSLKAIPDIKFGTRFEKGVYVNGVLYWYMDSCTRPRCGSNEIITSLICFNVSKEEVVTTMVPAELDIREGYESRIAQKGGNLCLVSLSYGPICSLLIKVYIADTSTDLSSFSSWKNEFNVTAPNMAYNISIKNAWSVSIVTDDMLVIRRMFTVDHLIFIDVPTGMMLSSYCLYTSVGFIPYVPSLVSLSHRPRHF